MEANVRSVRMEIIPMEDHVNRVQQLLDVQHVHRQRRHVRRVEQDIFRVVESVWHVHRIVTNVHHQQFVQHARTHII